MTIYIQEQFEPNPLITVSFRKDESPISTTVGESLGPYESVCFFNHDNLGTILKPETKMNLVGFLSPDYELNIRLNTKPMSRIRNEHKLTMSLTKPKHGLSKKIVT